VFSNNNKGKKMKKIVLAAMLTSGLMAADNGAYIGLDVGNTEVELKATVNGSSAGSVKDDGGSQTLKVGYYIDKNNRVAGFYQHVNAEDGSVGMYGVGYDYLIGDNAFKPFIGAMLGYGSFKVDNTPVNISGAVFGIQAGLNYSFNENFSAEAGYRYMKSNMEDSFSGIGGTANFEIDPIKNWFIGANYKF
jgi:opacity protein-like surface antigen